MMRLLLVGVLATALPLPALGQAAPGVLDSTWHFDVERRGWTWPYVSAEVGIGCRDSTMPVGITTAPDSAGGRARSLCVAALVEMRDARLTLTGARGVVRLRVPGTSGDAVGARDSTVQPRRMP